MIKSRIPIAVLIVMACRLFAKDPASQDPLAPSSAIVSSRIITAPALKQKDVDFNHPPRRYETNVIAGFPLFVEQELRDKNTLLADLAVNRLKEQVTELKTLLPGAAWPRFKRIKLFVMYGEDSEAGGRDNGLEYFQKPAPDYHDYLDPRMASSILIYSATNYVWLPKERALKALMHEFAHAYHLEQWPEAHAEMFTAWQNAAQRKLYAAVRDEKGTILAQGYATQNHLEYFAELSMIYFTGGYYEPFTREALKSRDVMGYALIETLWNINGRRNH